MVSKKTIINAIDMLNMDQCELADRVLNLEIRVSSLESKFRSMVAPADVKSAPKMGKTSPAKKTAKKATKKVAKRPVGRPSNKKK